MKLTANRVAQWLVQGDHYSIGLDGHHLVIESRNLTETIPFAIWNGELTVRRGLFWGQLIFSIFPYGGSPRRITVYGLPWRQLAQAAKIFTDSYQTWLSRQQQEFNELAPAFESALDALEQHEGFLRQSNVEQWQGEMKKLVAEQQVSMSLVALCLPDIYRRISPWMTTSHQRRADRNIEWQSREMLRWSTWFDDVESSPLNESQRKAVLMDDDHNLILAGAGSGKTSVLVARTKYLLTSGLAEPEQILMLAFGKKASSEMEQRLAAITKPSERANQASTERKNEKVKVATFHSFAREVIAAVKGEKPQISDLAVDEEAKLVWMSSWLAEHWQTPANSKRWVKHLSHWKLAGLTGEEALDQQAHLAPLHNWMWRRIDLLQQSGLSRTAIKEKIAGDSAKQLQEQNQQQFHGQYQQQFQDQKKPQQSLQATSELALVWPCYQAYLKQLKSDKAYDFNGLISEATSLLQKQANLKKKTSSELARFRFVMVDEYQDISPMRLALLEALCQSNPDNPPSLYAVGDDWQAIYRFSGADVGLTTGFEQRFPGGAVHYLDTTYRFNSQIGDVANRFVLQNSAQLTKPLNSFKQQSKKAVALESTGNEDAVLAKLAGKHSDPDKQASVLFIGRNNAHRPADLSAWKKQYPSLDINYVTAHASKGLEADYTMLVSVNEGTFPSKNRSEGLEFLMLSDNEEMEYAEERRLFYVALTRARQYVWVFCEPERASPFVRELIQGDYPVVSKLPKRKMGKTA